MKLYLIRHGITKSNIDKVFNGVNDEDLHELGIKDLESKKDKYKDIKFDYIYCSSLKRAIQSFKVLFDNLEINEIRDELVEMDFGDWAGLSYEEMNKYYLEKGYTFDDLIDPVNGESYKSLFNRTSKFIKEVIHKHENQTILILAHGLVIASIIYKQFPIEKNMYQLTPDNGLGYIIEIRESGYNVEIIK